MASRRPRRRGPQKNCTVIDESKNIISKSVIIHSSVNRPTSLILPVNTNLNPAPSNWLSSAAESYGLQNMSVQSGFSSFQMANKFIDTIDKVDIVSDAENIKQLLKIPFSKKSVSMMVHKVGDTFIIDEFDASKHLVVETQQKNWSWLKKFFSDHIFKSGQTEKFISRQVNSFNVIQEKTLNSKFLHYSIADTPNDSKNDNYQQSTTASELNPNILSLPQPFPEEQFPDYPKDHNFNQTMLWTFGDVKMMIGSDLPIFKNGTSFQSLRLKDLSKHSKSMNDLPLVDYWLDNLICNIPEVLLCHHLDGKVQKYEKVKTENLPKFEDKFLPNNFVYIARNLLSFLKSKVSKVGHTYWLYKGENESMITTYDLTTLCFEPSPQDQNLFTVPVAMLLYRVANHKLNSSNSEKKTHVIESLLYNSSKLLNKTNFPIIHAAINYMFSELYIPGKNDDNTTVKPFLSLLNNDELDQNYYRPINSIDIFNLYILHKINKSKESEYNTSKPVEISNIECYRKSFYNVACGLQIIQHINFTVYPQPGILDEPNTAYPSSSTLKANITKFDPKNCYSIKWKNNIIICQSGGIRIWKEKLRLLFLEKASLLCLSSCTKDFSLDKYGACMKHLLLLFECQIHIFGSTTIVNPLKEYIIEQIGKCYLRIAISWDNSATYKTEFEYIEDHKSIIIDFLKNECKHYSHEDLKLITCNFESKCDILKAVEYCFKRSLEFTVDKRKSNEIKKELCLAYIEHVTYNINHLLSAIKNSTKLILFEFEGILKTCEEYFDLQISIINKKYETSKLSNLYQKMLLTYSLALVYILKVNPDYRNNFEKNLEKKGLKYFNLSYEVLDKHSCNIADLDFCYSNLFDIFNLVGTKYVSLCSKAEVKNTDVVAIRWLEKSLYFYNMISKEHIKRSYIKKIAVTKTTLGDLRFKQLRLGVTINDANILRLCNDEYEDAFKIFLTENLPFRALEITNQKMLLEEFHMNYRKRSKMESITNIFHNLGLITDLFCKSINHELFLKENTPKLINIHDFNPVKYFKQLEHHLGFVLKHMIKVSTDETGALTGKTDEIKTIYSTLIQKKTEEDYTFLLETIDKITDIEL